jgi:hypothetical protein
VISGCENNVCKHTKIGTHSLYQEWREIQPELNHAVGGEVLKRTTKNIVNNKVLKAMLWNVNLSLQSEESDKGFLNNNNNDVGMCLCFRKNYCAFNLKLSFSSQLTL